MIDNKTIRQVVINSKIFPCNAKHDITVEGSIANFETDEATSLKSCICYINPIQTGTGDPSPSNPRPISGVSSVNVTSAGKNLIPIPSETMTSRSVDLIPQSDGTIKLEGTATGGTAVFDIARNLDFYLPSGTYFVNETSSPYSITVYSEINGTATLVKSGGGSFTLSERKKIFVRIGVASGTSTGVFINFQLEVGNTATTFEAYAGTLTPVSLGQTVYYGQLDVVTGKLLITAKQGTLTAGDIIRVEQVPSTGNYRVRIGAFENQKDQNAIINCPNYKTSDDGSNNTISSYGHAKIFIIDNRCIDEATAEELLDGLEIIYEIEEPIEVTLTAEQLETLIGVNNIWHDANGNIKIVYEKEGGTCNGIMKFLPIFYPNGKGVKHHGSTF